MLIFAKQNKLMTKSIKNLNKLKNKDFKCDISFLTDDIMKPLYEQNGCILFKTVQNFEKYLKNFENETHLEGSENELHMSDYILKENGLILLKFGFFIAEVFSLRLSNLFPKYKFKIIVMYDLVNEYGYNDCVVKFHRLRKGQSYLLDDLERYKSHAMGILDVK